LPEYRVRLSGRGHGSQVDLVVLARCPGRSDGLVAIAVEGKVSEPFGPTVGAWRRERSDNREKRLLFLCNELGLDADSLPDDVRYQLLHRAVSAIEVARAFATRNAVLLVHSFSPRRKGWEDFARFAGLLGIQLTPGQVSAPVELGTADLQLGWVADQPASRSA